MVKKSNHRKPPKPLSWNVPRGNCRFCGGPIIENGKVNRRKRWHSVPYAGSCLQLWQVMNDPVEARKFVFLRDKGTCQGCGMFSILMSDFDVDHIKPLFEAYGDHSYFEPGNLQLLCDGCHKIKTKEDMKLYNRVYRGTPKVENREP